MQQGFCTTHVVAMSMMGPEWGVVAWVGCALEGAMGERKGCGESGREGVGELSHRPSKICKILTSTEPK